MSTKKKLEKYEVRIVKVPMAVHEGSTAQKITHPMDLLPWLETIREQDQENCVCLGCGGRWQNVYTLSRQVYYGQVRSPAEEIRFNVEGFREDP